MPHKTVLIWPDPVLTKPSAPVEKVDDSIRALVQDMIDTMEFRGDSAGLAAPQIGVSLRLTVINIAPEQNEGNGTKGYQAFINPSIVEKSKETFIWDEGCLSIPDEHGKVTRFKRVVVEYTDIDGNVQRVEGFDYFGGCLQHEIDHLDGKLWVDYQSSLKKSIVRKKMLKLKQRLDAGHGCADEACAHDHA